MTPPDAATIDSDVQTDWFKPEADWPETLDTGARLYMSQWQFEAPKPGLEPTAASVPGMVAEEHYAARGAPTAPGEEHHTFGPWWHQTRPFGAWHFERSSFSKNRVWLRRTLSRLESVARLEDDWDGRGSNGTDQAVCLAAFRLVLQLALVSEEPLPVPFVCPIPGGTLQLEWDSDGKHVEIEFIDAHRLAVLMEDASVSDEAMRVDEFPVSSMDRIKDLLDWLVSA